MVKRRIKLKNFENTFVLSFVSDSPLADNLEAVLNERLASTYIDPHCLGLVFGVHFGLDVLTINGREYPAQTWIDLIDSPIFQENLKIGKYVGTIGHDTRPVSDYDVRGKIISHVIKDMWIEEGKGYMITLVKDNELGQELRSNLLSGVFLKPSTRGKLAVPGAKLMTPEVYTFLGVDYVTNPALPSTEIIYLEVESVQEEAAASESIENEEATKETNSIIEGEDKMEQDLNLGQELLTELRTQRDELKEQIQTLRDEIAAIKEENASLRTQIQVEQEAKVLAEKSASESLDKFKRISTAYTNRLSKCKAIESKYDELNAKYMAIESAQSSEVDYAALAKKLSEQSALEAEGEEVPPVKTEEIPPVEETQDAEPVDALAKLKEEVKNSEKVEINGIEYFKKEAEDEIALDDFVIGKGLFILLDAAHPEDDLILLEPDEFKKLTEKEENSDETPEVLETEEDSSDTEEIPE